MSTARPSQSVSEKRGVYFFLFAVIVLLLAIVYTSLRPVSLGKSVEVSFTDNAPHGLQIVPASCASVPPTTGDSGGYVISSGVQGASIKGTGYSFCVTNNTGSTFFLPTHAVGEVQAFYNAAPSLGLTVGPPSSFPY